MFGILYMALAVFIGYNLVVRLLPGLKSISCLKDPAGKSVKLDSWMVVLPAAFLTGTLLITWFTYIAAYAFYNTQKPMLYGNILSLPVFTAASLYIAYLKRDKFACFIRETVRTGDSRVNAFFQGAQGGNCFHINRTGDVKLSDVLYFQYQRKYDVYRPFGMGRFRTAPCGNTLVFARLEFSDAISPFRGRKTYDIIFCFSFLPQTWNFWV